MDSDASGKAESCRASHEGSRDDERTAGVQGHRLLPHDHQISQEVADILATLAREKRTISPPPARLSRECLASDILLLHNPARRANFEVLRSSETPSVLVEMGSFQIKTTNCCCDHHRANVVAAPKTGLEVLHTTDHDALSAAIAAAPPRWMRGRLSAKRPGHWG